MAAEYLLSKGMQILRSQYRQPFGEIDLIAQDGDEVVFVEVKSRQTATFGHPEESVTAEKIRHIVRVGERYLCEQTQAEMCWRIDVIAIEFDHQPPKITHLVNIDIPGTSW